MNNGWLFVIFFIILAMVFFSGRGERLIIGYSWLPASKRRLLDRQALCRFMGKCMLLFATTVAMGVAGQDYRLPWLQSMGVALFLATIVFMLVHGNTGNRFMLEQSKAQPQTKKPNNSTNNN